MFQAIKKKTLCKLGQKEGSHLPAATELCKGAIKKGMEQLESTSRGRAGSKMTHEGKDCFALSLNMVCHPLRVKSTYMAAIMYFLSSVQYKMEARGKEFEAISWNPSGEIEFSMADLLPAEKKIFFTENNNSNYYYYDCLCKSITFQSPLTSETCHVHILHRVEILFHLHETRRDRGNATMTHDAREVVEPVMEISSSGISQCNHLSSQVFCLFGWSNSKPR